MGRPVILVTGFGPFPGAPRNPTVALVRHLEAAFARRVARLGWRLETAVLPTVHAAISGDIARLIAQHDPAIILHFGLAGRRRTVTVETRALNLARPYRDAAGRLPPLRKVEPDGPFVRRVAVSVPRLCAATGARRSIDAGGYVCNRALYLSLAERRRLAAFIHIPRAAHAARRPARSERPTGAALRRMAERAVLELVRQVRRQA